MKRISVILGAAVVIGAAPPPGPQANYWMDVATSSGMGAGMGMTRGGTQPSMAQIQAMMNGGGGGGGQHSLNLYLASKTKAAAPQAQHLIPPGMQMGPSLPLVAPPPSTPERFKPGEFQRPRGRMLIYWGCGEHSAAGQPTVVDFAKIAPGQMPPGFASMMSAMHAAQPPHAGQSAGFGEWPNDRDSRPVPNNASLVGAHKVEGNYSPPIGFSLAAGQDFMPALGLREAGASPSGAAPLAWTPAAQATGYALSMFGGTESGDVIVWTSANKASAFPNMDYLSPTQVGSLVASGAVLAPSTSHCTVPAEVVQASPAGMVMMIGYGPEASFSDKPKAPTWTVRARYKTTASLMIGMAGMFGDSGDEPQAQQQPQQQQPKKKKRGFGLGDLLQAVPH